MQSVDPISLEAQFLTCRILFFMTVNRPDLVSRLIHANISAPLAKVNYTHDKKKIGIHWAAKDV